MAWTQYLTTQDTIVRVTRREGGPVEGSEGIIRPTTLDFDVEVDGDAVLITVPLNENGHRFLVEFNDNLWEYRIGDPGNMTNSHYVQNKNPNGARYVEEYADELNPILGVEPLNALLVFMSPFPQTSMCQISPGTRTRCPRVSSPTSRRSRSRHSTPPGVYWLTGFNHPSLSDSINTYYSDVLCEHMTVWKTNNAPMIQFGWYTRDVDNVTVNAVQVVHTRCQTQQVFWPRGIAGSAVSYLDQASTRTADVSKTLSNYSVTNARCEGICPNLVGINPLNIDTFLMKNIWIETLPTEVTDVGKSTFRVFIDEEGNEVQLGAQSPGGIGLVIEDFYVGDEKFGFENDNWRRGQLGQIDFDEHWDGKWTLR
ncbi:Dextranase-like protein [Emericellopsis cladophorae]|uniref:Dextranase-like protein n=1 Tax=Emericellopsis cladophorae TaxID=2686198 RepID=A0A9P9XUK6_9HYPO|nr:Dextranase-like protein [Emericellopsis cladophorae]KAI6778000.1 Dextranase-like protein [Emericellopsis cladophorae]